MEISPSSPLILATVPKGRDQHQALALGLGGGELGLRGGDIRTRGCRRPRGARGLGAGLLLGAGGHEAALDELRLPRGLAFGVVGHGAGLLHALARWHAAPG